MLANDFLANGVGKATIENSIAVSALGIGGYCVRQENKLYKYGGVYTTSDAMTIETITFLKCKMNFKTDLLDRKQKSVTAPLFSIEFGIAVEVKALVADN